MKPKRIYVAIFVCFLAGIYLLANVQMQDEKRQQRERLLSQGNYLVSLIALHPISDFSGEKGKFILRTVREYISSDDLVYCCIHDHEGNLLASHGLPELVSKVPKAVQSQSLYASGLRTQSFPIKGSNWTIHEFAKPVFEHGQRSGTVRLGFKLTSPPLFYPERIKMLGMIALFIFTMGAFIYYGITLALRRLNHLSLGVKGMVLDSEESGAGSGRTARVDHIIEDLEKSLLLLRTKMVETEKDKAELEARFGMSAFQKNQLTNILDAMKLGVILTDSQDNIMHINVYMLALLNRKREEMVDQPISEVLEHEDLLSFLVQQGIEGQGQQSNHAEISFPTVAPGNLFQVSTTYLRDGEEAVVGKMILVDDITNEKLAEKAKQEFVAHVTHELYTPLTTIKSYNEMLMGGEVRDGDTQREFYNTIMEETDRLQRLIENLLNISKIEMGSLTLDRGLVKSDWLVHDCVAAVEGAALKKQITIEKVLPDNYPSLLGDKELLKVAIINILGNAVKYTPEQGKITFCLSEENNTAVFHISDTGYGISAEDLPHIFDKFYRSKDPNVSEKTGSGLGLGITSEIIHLHGGKIEVESQPGEGTHFSVKVPREEYYVGNP